MIGRASDLGTLGGTRTPNLLVRRSGHIVQDGLFRSLRWADIPQLSVWDAPCPAAWLQHWLQSRRPGADPRASAFQAGHIPSWRGSCGRPALSPVAAACRWLLLLLPPLLSAAIRRPGGACCGALPGVPPHRTYAARGRGWDSIGPGSVHLTNTHLYRAHQCKT